jgi:hypothetical protein
MISTNGTQLEHSHEPFSGSEESLAGADNSKSRKRPIPRVKHLPSGTHVLPSGEIIPLFDVGTKLMVQRFSELLPGNPYLDTRVGKVTAIDDETHTVHMICDELWQHFAVCYASPLTTVKLIPEKKNPFAGTGKRKKRRGKRTKRKS